MRKTIKHRVYTTEEKIQIVLLYIDHHMGTYEILRKYDLANNHVLQRWVKQYLETGTIVEKRVAEQNLKILTRGDEENIQKSHLKK